MYKLLKPVLFLFDPETIHKIVFKLIKTSFSIPGVKPIFKKVYIPSDKKLERTLFGITFPSPVGMAAGFDKDAKLFDELYCLGFGFVEIGTITPLAQPGNPKPRLFRLPQDQALINRMGFNNEGVKSAAERLRKRKTPVIIGGNIGKNKSTPNNKATDDYLSCYQALYPVVDYFVVNVSSPNTPGLRELQEKEPLTELLTNLEAVNRSSNKRKPILLKIAPDLTNDQLDDIIDIVRITGIDGVIATNTTIDRSGLSTSAEKVEKIGMGGLSGKPVKNRSTEVIRYLAEKSGKAFPIVGVGGIHSAEDALEKFNAGADLVQVYTGFIYEGPDLVQQIHKKLRK